MVISCFSVHECWEISYFWSCFQCVHAEHPRFYVFLMHACWTFTFSCGFNICIYWDPLGAWFYRDVCNEEAANTRCYINNGPRAAYFPSVCGRSAKHVRLQKLWKREGRKIGGKENQNHQKNLHSQTVCLERGMKLCKSRLKDFQAWKSK